MKSENSQERIIDIEFKSLKVKERKVEEKM
jgi:hypothetical protein